MLPVASLAAIAIACTSVPLRTVRIQGTVTSVGFRLPVPAAEVIVEWPPTLGGGATTVKTDGEGRYVVGRTMRVRDLVCRGIAFTVRAPGFASAYSRPEVTCGPKVLSFDFDLFPLPG